MCIGQRLLLRFFLIDRRSPNRWVVLQYKSVQHSATLRCCLHNLIIGFERPIGVSIGAIAKRLIRYESLLTYYIL